jgi:RNA polymerase sigma-70 factor (ECF subfamily)
MVQNSLTIPWSPVTEQDSEQSPAQAMDVFLASVERRALRIAEVATRDRDEALDIVQDAMLQLARSYERRPRAEWPPLFYRILQNKVRDWQRRRAVKSRLFWWQAPTDESAPDPVAELADPRPTAPDLTQRAQALQHLERALRDLPGRQREAFELRIWEGLSVEDTAQTMGCSGGSVKTHLSRALAALRAQLQGVWP